MELYLVINKLRKTHNQMLWAARFNIYAGFKYSIGLNQLMQMQNEYIIITAKLKKRNENENHSAHNKNNIY